MVKCPGKQDNLGTYIISTLKTIPHACSFFHLAQIYRMPTRYGRSRRRNTSKSFLKKPFSGGGGETPENMHFPCVTKSIVKIIIQYAQEDRAPELNTSRQEVVWVEEGKEKTQRHSLKKTVDEEESGTLEESK